MIERGNVLWFGPRPDDVTECEFRNRELTLVFPTENVDEGQFIGARVAVFYFSGSTLTAVRQSFVRECARAVNHGLLVYLLAENDAVQDHIGTLIPMIEDPHKPLRRTKPVLHHEIAEAGARHKPGREYNASLKLEGSPANDLSPDDRFFLHRAFNDCTAIELTSLPGGRSGTVFSVQATFRDSRAGPRPLPFFAKIDDAKKVKTEHDKYQDFATYHIPFNFRPNLDSTRCIHGATRGVLVGNFVDKSDSLWEIARKGMGSRLIHALFEDTLRGWRSQAGRREPIDGPVAGALRTIVDVNKVRQENVEFARTQGVIDAPNEVWEKLLGLRNQSYRVAPMHGDMHGENVRVRGNDAIVIDLLSVIGEGPLSADLAGLETWLAFETAPSDRSDEEQKRWMRFIDELYEPTAIKRLPALEGLDLSFTWLRDCVRQIRMIACTTQQCDSEYQTVIAVYLLRRSMYPGDSKADTVRRGYAFLTASRIVAHLVEARDA